MTHKRGEIKTPKQNSKLHLNNYLNLRQNDFWMTVFYCLIVSGKLSVSNSRASIQKMGLREGCNSWASRWKSLEVKHDFFDGLAVGLGLFAIFCVMSFSTKPFVSWQPHYTSIFFQSRAHSRLVVQKKTQYQEKNIYNLAPFLYHLRLNY